jgi:hypothetical protein
MRKHFITMIVAVAGAILISSTALAAGEAKNETPFTRLASKAETAPTGEAKNQLPFTRSETSSTAIPDVLERYAAAHAYGRGITTVPDVFERYAAAHPYGRGLGSTGASSVAQSEGHDRRNLAIGGAAAAGLVLIGMLGLDRSRRRAHAPTPVV